MQDKQADAPPLADHEIGRGSPDMKLVAKLFDGFADATRMSILALLARRGRLASGNWSRPWGRPNRGFRITCGAWRGAGT